MDTTDAIDNGCPCLPDYPEFGIDQNNVYITTNEFSISGPTFNGAQIYAISKSQIEALKPAPNFVHFGKLSIGGAMTYHVQPAIAYTAAPAGFFMDSLDPNSTFDNRMGVWAMTNGESVTIGRRHAEPVLDDDQQRSLRDPAQRRRLRASTASRVNPRRAW